MRSKAFIRGVAAALGGAILAPAAFAAPTITITPPDGARFLPDQRFDVRVEVKPASGSPSGVTLTLDGASVAFSSTDSLSGSFGYNRRALSTMTPGVHTLVASAADSSGGASATAQFEVVNTFGARRPARNVIILLGDGMGIQHRTAARIVRFGLTGGRPNGALAMDTMPTVGLVSTSSLNSLVTDSSPGMACYTTGNKANNNQEGVFPATVSSPFAQPRVEYMSEYLHRKFGKSLGIVSTADVEDATPAANAVHTGNRNAGQGICDQYLDESGNSGLTVLLGGGRRWFLPSGQFGSSRSANNDYGPLPTDLTAAYGIPAGAVDPARNLLGDFQSAGFTYVANATELTARAAGATKLLGLFGYGNMNVAYDKIAKRRGAQPGAATFVVDDYFAPDQPMLDDMTSAALTVLNKNQNGFVLMVEGAHIDKQSHAMDADRATWETIEFDNAVRKCLDFADRVGDTMVIVTADHECAGFSILGGLSQTPDALRALPSDKTVLDPAVRPARQGVVSGTGFPKYTILADGFPATADIAGKMLIGFGADADHFEDRLAKPLPVIDGLLPDDIKASLNGKTYPVEPINRKPESDNGFFVRGQIGGAQAGHTASDIPLSAYSSSSRAFQQFNGVQDNTDVFFKLMRAVLGGY